MKNELLHTEDTIKSKILNIRGQQVMIDRDLAGLYEVHLLFFCLYWHWWSLSKMKHNQRL